LIDNVAEPVFLTVISSPVIKPLNVFVGLVTAVVEFPIVIEAFCAFCKGVSRLF